MDLVNTIIWLGVLGGFAYVFFKYILPVIKKK